MLLMHRVALDGTQLDSVDANIMIKGVATQQPREADVATSAGYNGQRYLRKRRESLDVTVRVGLKIFDDDMDDREELLEAISDWANKLPAWLTTTQKPNRRIRVDAVKTPAAGDPAEWTNEYTYTFTAYEDPYWQDTSATTKTLTQGSSGSDSITVPGSAESFADVTIQNKSGTVMDSITVSINGNQMSFNNLNLANNGTLTIDHVLTGGVYVIRARIGNTSVLNLRSGADDFITKGGANAITYSADGSASVSVSVKGRYL